MAFNPTNQTDDAAGYEVVEHTADWALEVWGRDLPALFKAAAVGMSSLMAEDLAAVSLTTTRRVKLDAFDPETLLVDWLSELAYWAEDELLVFYEFDLVITGQYRLAAVARGGKAEHLTKHIKAVTYNDLVIKHDGQFWRAAVVFDV